MNTNQETNKETNTETNKETIIYNQNKEEIGIIGKGIELIIDNEKITENTKYFKTTIFGDDYYIKYQDVDKIDALSEINDRYKNYILFNENIITNDKTSFYDDNDNLVYTFNKFYDLPIIIKDDDKYGIEFNSRLLYVKKEGQHFALQFFKFIDKN